MTSNLDKEKNSLPVLRYLILGLFLWNLPAFLLTYMNGSISSLISYISYALLVLYVVINGKSGNSKGMLLLGLSYFLISGLVDQQYMPDFRFFLVIAIKYFIVIWGGYEVLKKTSKIEMWWFLMIGALSILGNMFLFNDPKADYGRYSGFYLDPNNGGLICLMGFSASFLLPKVYKIVGKAAFTLLGLFTLSRTFVITWILINILSIKLSIKNIKMLAIGFGILSSLLIYNEFLPVKNPRLEQISASLTGNESKSKGIDKDSRWHTWSRYYDALQNKPILGNGYQSFLGSGIAPPVGVHNTYLLIWGEGGIIPITIFLVYMIWLFFESYKVFNDKPHLLMMMLGLSLFLMTNHNFLTSNYSLFILLWIHIQVKETSKQEDLINLKVNTIEA
ncbi:hypothetical protein SAMN04488007_3326 [Maribacter aquivivus]|uniref:O-antigen ligase-related domain-containing protein n=1 Tax=Maribacter aquivivus TaxID=228958 RepID=A0A1M6TQX5_9FLAO|nr:O-antigen ligase family protein [Maribacter aquivivus]SHK59375.1 hypothetical protein SAMN04488007_3326 [Maribacter aquivivus]